MLDIRQTFQHARDSQGAFLALHDHNLGPNNVDNMASLAEKKLAMMMYTGERRCWTFEKFVTLHKDHHSILEGFVEKTLFSIGLVSSCADQFSSCALLQSGIVCLHVSFTAYEYFYKLSKCASLS